MNQLYRRLAPLAAVLAVASSAFPQFHGRTEPKPDKVADEAPPVLQQVTIEQRLGNQVPMDLVFRDEQNREVRLKDYAGKRPILLSLVYYGCPMLCTEILNGLTRSLRTLPMELGKDYEVITVSFDPTETATLAATKKGAYLDSLRKPGADKHWHWLTGNQDEIRQLTEAVGFKYVWDEKLQQYAHGSGIILLTPEGKVSRYFYGIDYSSVNLRLGLTEASGGKIGSLAEKVMLFCYHYDPTRGTYAAKVTIALVRAGGLMTLLGVGGFMFVMLRREARQRRAAQQAG